LNRRQLWCLWVGIAALVAMLLVPPWMSSGGGPLHLGDMVVGSSTGPSALGYGLIFDPPHGAHEVDLGRLGIQVVIVGLIVAGMLATLADHQKPN
jgi:hypothetical protein